MTAIRKERDQLRVILAAQKTGLTLVNPDLTIAWANDETQEALPRAGARGDGLPCLLRGP